MELFCLKFIGLLVYLKKLFAYMSTLTKI